MQRSIITVLWTDHESPLGGGGGDDLNWCRRSCEKGGKSLVGARKLTRQGLISIPPYCAVTLLPTSVDNITVASRALFIQLSCQFPDFEAALDQLQFTFTVNRLGVYDATEKKWP